MHLLLLLTLLNFTQPQVLADPEPFLTWYVEMEAPFFERARHPESGLTYDGWNLDPLEPRQFSAPSKECLDVALLAKSLEGHPLAVRLVSQERAAEILRKKLASYRAWYHERPEYGGYFPWFRCGDTIEPTPDWEGSICGLDNGEWAWAMLAAERAARKADPALARELAEYNAILRRMAVPIFYDPVAGLVRGDAKITDSGYATDRSRAAWLTGEHGVHEGVMLVLFVTLYGEGLPQDAQERIWSGTRMLRVEHEYGTSWQGWYGSAHEEWAWMFLPFRDLPEYDRLFAIRQAIRTRNARDRGYPGLHASALEPGGPGYWDGAGIEGLNAHPFKHQEFFALYGAFPVLLEDRPVGAAWLLNMLAGPGQLTSLGGGESGTMDGAKASRSKTIDGTFTNLLAVCDGLDAEIAAMMREDGVYDRFREIMEQEYREAFGTAPLRSEGGLVPPGRPVPGSSQSAR